ncbi:MAG: MFS transporter [Actinomycetota bacterium]|nr:MFS transporter [Actinomycetota bacterium]
MEEPALAPEIADHLVQPERMVSARFVIVTLATFFYFLSMGMLIPTLPRYVEDELGAGGIAVGVVVGAFAVSAALARPWAGRLGDVRGRRLLMVGGSIIVGVTTLAYALTDAVPLLVFFRFLTGFGEAAVFVGAATAIQDMAPDDRRGEAASIFSVALYGGLAFGPIIGERVADTYTFHTVWVVSGLFALVAAALGMGTAKRVEGIIAKPTSLLHPNALGPGLVLMLGLVPFTGFAAFLSLYGEEVGIDDVGPVFGAYAIAVLVIRLLGARLPDTLGWRKASTIALIAVTTAAVIIGAWESAAAVWVASGFFAIGMSLLFPALFSAAMIGVPDEQRSQAVGTFSLFFDLANGLGAPLLGLIVSLTSYRGAFLASALIAALGFAAQVRLQRKITGDETPGTAPAH